MTLAARRSIRWGWLKAMYIYTIVCAGAFGLGILGMPAAMRSLFGWPEQNPILLGVAGSVLLSFALLSILGLRAPLEISPVLLLQLSSTVLWFPGVFLPRLIAGDLPPYALLHVVIFATFLIGNLLAIPFSYLFAKE